MLRALLFDFDGLILDTETPEVQVLSEMFAEHGHNYPDSYWTYSIGRGAEQKQEGPFELLERLLGSKLNLAELESDRDHRTTALIELQPIRSGVEDMLGQAEQLGLSIGIASSSHHRWVDLHLKRIGLYERFKHIFCADDVSRAKPHPDLYIKLMSEMNISANEAFALEDSPNGVRAAKGAGLPVVAVENPMTMRLDLSEADLRLATLEGVKVLEIWHVLMRPTQDSSAT